MRPTYRSLPRVSQALRSIALGVVALCGLAGAGESAAAGSLLVVADLAAIPTSPSFRMGMRRGETGAPALTHGDELTATHGAAAATGGAPGGLVVVNGGKDAKAGGTAASAPAGPASHSAASPGRASTGTASAGTASVGAAPSRSAPRSAGRGDMPPADVMEHLRERLAEKLGATPSGGDSRYVMRVSNRGESGENIVSSARTSGPSGGHARTAAAVGSSPASAGESSAGHAAHASWDYGGGSAGPESWGRLPGAEKCAAGTRQSPIDIRDGITVDLDPIHFEYRPGAFSVIDNGHTVQVDVAPGNAINVMGRRYELVQFHFHRPAEERIDGRTFDMVVHLVHKDAAGRLAVVAVLLERGAPHPVVQAVWNNLPLEKGEALSAQATLDPAGLLPEDRRYYTYMGSLTTPPCSEGVLWMVLKKPVTLSPEQDATFAHLYPMNARPIQPASGRLIKSSN